MKKLNIFIFLLSLLFIPSLQSCLGDDTPSLQIAIGTITTISEDDFYILQDNSDKLYVGDISRIKDYKIEDGQRVFVYYNILDKKLPGYTVNIEIVAIDNIDIRNISLLTEKNQETIGNDRVNIEEIWIGGGFINIRFKYYSSYKPDKAHTFNLVINEISDQPENTDYFELEFRHNSMEDSRGQWLEKIISFREETELADIYAGKGLRIKSVTEPEGEERIITLDFVSKK